VNEHVLPVFLTDKPIPLFVTEPLNRTASQSLDLLSKTLLGPATQVVAPADEKGQLDSVDPKKCEPNTLPGHYGAHLIEYFRLRQEKTELCSSLTAETTTNILLSNTARARAAIPIWLTPVPTPVFCTMTKDNESVTYLKKVHLLIQAGTSLQSGDLTPGAVEMEFVFGVGSHGLTPFEAQLADKPLGYQVDLQIPAGGLHVFFGHIFPPLRRLPDQPGTIFLRVQIDGVAQAESQEVVKALAEVANCGDHCCGH
jgi:hypothetical protein